MGQPSLILESIVIGQRQTAVFWVFRNINKRACVCVCFGSCFVFLCCYVSQSGCRERRPTAFALGVSDGFREQAVGGCGRRPTFQEQNVRKRNPEPIKEKPQRQTNSLPVLGIIIHAVFFPFSPRAKKETARPKRSTLRPLFHSL